MSTQEQNIKCIWILRLSSDIWDNVTWFCPLTGTSATGLNPSGDTAIAPSDQAHLQPPSSPGAGSCFHGGPCPSSSSCASSSASHAGHHQHPLSASSLLTIAPGFLGSAPGQVPHSGLEDAGLPLGETACGGGGSLTSISQSQPSLCTQPSNHHSSDFSNLLSSAPTSTHSLLTAPPYPHLYPSATEPALPPLAPPHSGLSLDSSATPPPPPPLLPSSSHRRSPDTTSLLDGINMEDGFCLVERCPSSPPPMSSCSSPSSPPPLSTSIARQPSVSSLGSSPLRPLPLPLGDSSAVGHTSLECLLGEQGSMESRDSEQSGSPRSSVGPQSSSQSQTQSSETSWSLDLMDWGAGSNTKKWVIGVKKLRVRGE